MKIWFWNFRTKIYLYGVGPELSILHDLLRLRMWRPNNTWYNFEKFILYESYIITRIIPAKFMTHTKWLNLNLTYSREYILYHRQSRNVAIAPKIVPKMTVYLRPFVLPFLGVFYSGGCRFQSNLQKLVFEAFLNLCSLK